MLRFTIQLLGWTLVDVEILSRLAGDDDEPIVSPDAGIAAVIHADDTNVRWAGDGKARPDFVGFGQP